MPGKFEKKLFADIDLTDPFFDSLKKDYPEFKESWFPKGIQEGRKALVFSDDQGLGAFIAMKEENEPIQLEGLILPACSRLKISTLRLAERFRGQRLGEGAIGLLLWEWQARHFEEIYATVFPSHEDVIIPLRRFGFELVGKNSRGEYVFLRSRKKIDFSDPYKCFPFISPNFLKGGYLIVNDNYHDSLFPYSELSNTIQEQVAMDAANGVTKIYVGEQWQTHYKVGEPVFIYRRFTGPGTKRYKSCLTSYATVVKVTEVKRNGIAKMELEQFLRLIGNKSVFEKMDLSHRYQNSKNLTVIHLLYNGYFGKGHNITMDWLDNQGFWAQKNEYPANVQLSPSQCTEILRKGGIDIDNIQGR